VALILLLNRCARSGRVAAILQKVSDCASVDWSQPELPGTQICINDIFNVSLSQLTHARPKTIQGILTNESNSEMPSVPHKKFNVSASDHSTGKPLGNRTNASNSDTPSVRQTRSQE